MKKIFLICFAASLFLSSCIFHYTAHTRQKVDSRGNEFVLDLEHPGDIAPVKLEYDGLEYRGFTLLDYTKVITFIEQRNALADSSKLLLDEYEKTIKFTNEMIDEYNDGEDDKVTMAYVSSASIVTNIVLILLLVLLL